MAELVQLQCGGDELKHFGDALGVDDVRRKFAELVVRERLGK